MVTTPSDAVRLALLEESVHRHDVALFGLDGESGMSGRMRSQERFQARIGGFATLGAVLGGMAVDLLLKLIS